MLLKQDQCGWACGQAAGQIPEQGGWWLFPFPAALLAAEVAQQLRPSRDFEAVGSDLAGLKLGPRRDFVSRAALLVV